MCGHVWRWVWKAGGVVWLGLRARVMWEACGGVGGAEGRLSRGNMEEGMLAAGRMRWGVMDEGGQMWGR